MLLWRSVASKTITFTRSALHSVFGVQRLLTSMQSNLTDVLCERRPLSPDLPNCSTEGWLAAWRTSWMSRNSGLCSAGSSNLILPATSTMLSPQTTITHLPLRETHYWEGMSISQNQDKFVWPISESLFSIYSISLALLQKPLPGPKSEPPDFKAIQLSQAIWIWTSFLRWVYWDQRRKWNL